MPTTRHVLRAGAPAIVGGLLAVAGMVDALRLRTAKI